jgi:type IV secretory pathway VirB6-like protein
MSDNVFIKLYEITPDWLKAIISFIDDHVVLIILLATVSIIVGVALYDVLQTKHTIKRNFPVIGFARYFLEFIGPE